MDIEPRPVALAALSDAELLEAVQRQTFRFFWEGAHPLSGLALDRLSRAAATADDRVAVGGSGFGIMTLIVAAERGWVSRDAALERLGRMLGLLGRASRYHGAYPHFMDGATGATIPFNRVNDGGDLVETALLCMGLLCARQYFARDAGSEQRLRREIDALWHAVEWDWYTQGGRPVLYWHWSSNHGWVDNLEIRGWNECLITYVLAAASTRHGIDPAAYHEGFAARGALRNGNRYYGIELPLGPAYGGPLSFSQYSFCGLDPRGLVDRYADYWQQNVRQVAIHRAHAIANRFGHRGYGESCWGLSASDDPDGYREHSPALDNGTIAPTAPLASMPYAPEAALQVVRRLLRRHGARVFGRFGFVDAFCEDRNWFADNFLAIDQGPIIIMIENYRSGLLWRLFMSAAEVQAGLRKLDFRLQRPKG